MSDATVGTTGLTVCSTSMDLLFDLMVKVMHRTGRKTCKLTPQRQLVRLKLEDKTKHGIGGGTSNLKQTDRINNLKNPAGKKKDDLRQTPGRARKEQRREIKTQINNVLVC